MSSIWEGKMAVKLVPYFLSLVDTNLVGLENM